MYSNYTNSVKERANLGECGFEESDTLYTDRQPSKASLVLGTVATELNDIHPTTGHFNPDSKRYRLCCCANVKTFTIATGIVEMFLICFLLVAVLPDLSINLCTPSKNDMAIERLLGSSNVTVEQNSFDFAILNFTNSSIIFSKLNLDTVQKVSCSIGIGWFFWMFVHIISINFLFYGCKNNKWKFLLPHLVVRSTLTVVFVLVIALLIIVLLNPITTKDLKQTVVILVIGVSMVALLVSFITAIELRCAEFVKKSEETGFSTTTALSMRVPVTPFSDGRGLNQQPENPSVPAITGQQEEALKFDEESHPVTLPSLYPVNGARRRSEILISRARRGSEAFSENPLHLRNLPPLRHTYRPG